MKINNLSIEQIRTEAIDIIAKAYLELGQNPDAAMADKVRGFPGFLSSIGVTLIGSYTPVGQGLSDTTPGVTIVETDDPSKLNQITMYYQPYLNYRFQTYQQVQRPS